MHAPSSADVGRVAATLSGCPQCFAGAAKAHRTPGTACTTLPSRCARGCGEGGGKGQEGEGKGQERKAMARRGKARARRGKASAQSVATLPAISAGSVKGIGI